MPYILQKIEYFSSFFLFSEIFSTIYGIYFAIIFVELTLVYRRKPKKARARHLV